MQTVIMWILALGAVVGGIDHLLAAKFTGGIAGAVVALAATRQQVLPIGPDAPAGSIRSF